MASKRRVRKRKCGNKVQHTKEAAHRAAATLGKKDLDRLKAYRCPFCKAWHVGHWSAGVRHRRRKHPKEA